MNPARPATFAVPRKQRWLFLFLIPDGIQTSNSNRGSNEKRRVTRNKVSLGDFNSFT